MGSPVVDLFDRSVAEWPFLVLCFATLMIPFFGSHCFGLTEELPGAFLLRDDAIEITRILRRTTAAKNHAEGFRVNESILNGRRDNIAWYNTVSARQRGSSAISRQKVTRTDGSQDMRNM